MSTRKKVSLAVGEDITTPAGVARNGRIRIRSAEAAEVARWFGLGRLPRRRKRPAKTLPSFDARCVELKTGTITLITGASGAGKSSLLRELRRAHASRVTWIDLQSLRCANVPIVNCFEGQELMETLKLLGRVGLGEAWSYLRTPAELSDGQRFRLKLAMGLWRVGKALATEVASPGRLVVLVCDEFAATLDRLTARIVARCLRRAIDADGRVAAVVATSHDDLAEALSPDVVVWCDFGRVEMKIRADESG